jgi:thiol-disulfide isomerase/thioredoxin
MSKDPRTAPRSARPLIIFGLVAIFATIAWRMYQDSGQRFVGTAPREFPSDGVWIGTDQFLHLAALRGKVVLLQFSFLACPYCREMDPYLHKWQQEFSSDGFVVVEVDDGGSDSLEGVRSWATDSKISYPVYYDAGGQLCGSYDIHEFPTLLLVGRDGKIVWEGKGWSGNEGIAKLEKEIRKTLQRRAGD